MKHATRLFPILLSITLASCTTNPYTGEQQASKAATYGGGAAAACGLIGAMDSREKAIRAALACGLVGAGVGAYMDAQEAKLREQLQGTGVQVVREGNNIRLVMPGNITFATDSYSLKPEFYATLNSVGLVLSEFHETTMRITGHTDNTGGYSYNKTLSQQRAQAVATYLAGQGVVSGRIFIRGVGYDQPIADNRTSQGRAQNRRVELYILPQQP